MSHRNRYSIVPYEMLCEPCKVGDTVEIMRPQMAVENPLTGETLPIPTRGKAIYVSPRGWATLAMINHRGKVVYNETAWFTRR